MKVLDPSGLTEEEKWELAELLEAKLNQHERTKLFRYKPYAKQLEFHALGSIISNREIMLIAGNQLGKTYSAAAEVAIHLTGEYPAWWPGAVWEHEITCWAGSDTSQTTRDTVQRLLLGKPGEWGTGMIPGDSIISIKRAAGAVPDVVDTVMVKHRSGGVSKLTFKSYDQGRQKWQGETLDLVWLDEEPPWAIYSEATTRTNATEGVTLLTFTPLLGISDVVKRFTNAKAPGTAYTTMTVYDVGHYTKTQADAIVAKYPEHERDARAFGKPVLGSGAIYPVLEDGIKVKPFQIPDFWPRIAAMDFGWEHPTAAIWLAYDPDNDVIYLTHAYREKKLTPLQHSAALKAPGAWIPMAWPHDGEATGRDGGRPLAEQYRDLGVAMLDDKATHPPQEGDKEGTGGNAVDVGLLQILERMQTGRFKVFEHLSIWFDEMRLYHRKDGKIVKLDDDLMDATRYAVMMLRWAKIKPAGRIRPVGGSWKPADPGMGY